MPTYDYECRACGTRFEVIHSMLEDGPQTCERCGGPLRRILYPAGIIFKGSGFYATDSRAAARGATDAGNTGAGDKRPGDAGAGDKRPGDKGASDAGAKPEPSKRAGGSEAPSTSTSTGGSSADSGS